MVLLQLLLLRNAGEFQVLRFFFYSAGNICRCVTMINNGVDPLLTEAIGLGAGYQLARMVCPASVTMLTDSVSLLFVCKPDPKVACLFATSQ